MYNKWDKYSMHTTNDWNNTHVYTTMLSAFVVSNMVLTYINLNYMEVIQKADILDLSLRY